MKIFTFSRQIKRYFFNLRKVLLYYFSNKYDFKKELPTVCVYLSKNDLYVRGLIGLLTSLNESGYNVIISPNLKYLITVGDEFGLFKMPWVKLSFRVSPKKQNLIITDTRKKQQSLERFNIDSCLLMHENPNMLIEENCKLPYFMHPKIYLDGMNKLKSFENKENEKDIRILFVGNIDSLIYNFSEIKNNYGINTRYEIFERIEKMDLNILWIKTWGDKEMLKEINKEIVIVNSYKAGLTHNEYFNLLSRSDFVISPPGVGVPYCHNLPESLSFGCIPIIQFPAISSPRLKNGFTCLSFDTIEQLDIVINRAFNMNREDIDQIKININNLYKSEYDNEKLLQKVKNYKTLYLKTENTFKIKNPKSKV
jgi:hypothetical protein